MTNPRGLINTMFASAGITIPLGGPNGHYKIMDKTDPIRNKDGSFTQVFLERSAIVRQSVMEDILLGFDNHAARLPLVSPDEDMRPAFNINPLSEGGSISKDLLDPGGPFVPVNPWSSISEAMSFYGLRPQPTIAVSEVKNNWEFLKTCKHLIGVGRLAQARKAYAVANWNDTTFINICHKKLIERGFYFTTVSQADDCCFYGKFQNNRLIAFYYVETGHDFKVMASVDEVDELRQWLIDYVNAREWKMPESTAYTVTGYDDAGDFVTSESTIDQDQDMASPEFYPWFKDSLTDYIREYVDSKTSVLLCIGDPGTGKSTFIRTAINLNGLKALIVPKPEIFMHTNFVTNCKKMLKYGQIDIVIMEDADMYIRPRSDNNHRMQELLDATNGIDASVRTKFVFTTNLKDISDVDSALLRPGRAFDYLRFRKLTRAEAVAIRVKLGLPPLSFKGVTDNREFTLAEATAATEPSSMNEGIIKPRY